MTERQEIGRIIENMEGKEDGDEEWMREEAKKTTQVEFCDCVPARYRFIGWKAVNRPVSRLVNVCLHYTSLLFTSLLRYALYTTTFFNRLFPIISALPSLSFVMVCAFCILTKYCNLDFIKGMFINSSVFHRF